MYIDLAAEMYRESQEVSAICLVRTFARGRLRVRYMSGMRWVISLFLVVACSPDEPKPKPVDTGPFQRPIPPATFIDGNPARLVGIGDVHGDFKAAKKVLRKANLTDADNKWIAGDTIAVQVGDQVDRGDQDRKILDFFEDMSEQAFLAGGGFYPLIGNHEVMNVDIDLRYVTPAALEEFADIEFDPEDEFYDDLEDSEKGRAAAFRPGGPYAKMLAGHNTVMVVGDTAFVHGGLQPGDVAFGLEKLNLQTQKWMKSKRRSGPDPLRGNDGVVWTRIYSDDDEAPPDCATLIETLDAIPAKRLVVAHTVQQIPNAACDGKVWRIDVGMSAYYGGSPAAIEIMDGEVTVLE